MTPPRFSETIFSSDRPLESLVEAREQGAQIGVNIDRAFELFVEEDPEAEEIRDLEKLKDELAEVTAAVETRAARYEKEYIMDPALALIVEKAKVMGKPLYVEGAPGTGKTALAYALAAEWGAEVIHCRGKTNLTAQDVLYKIDHVARLRDASMSTLIPDHLKGESRKWANFLEEGGSSENEQFQRFMNRLDSEARLVSAERVSDVGNYIIYGELGRAIVKAARGEDVVLLLDEIDKTKREFPNDLLDEIEHLVMLIRETGEEISAPKGKIFVLITSNNERDLPDAFKRRVFFHVIEFPDREQMARIVRSNFPDLETSLAESVLDRFYQLRATKGLIKEPTTSELLDWIGVLSRDPAITTRLPEDDIPYPGVIFKNKEDIELVQRRHGKNMKSPEDMKRHKYVTREGMQIPAFEALSGSHVLRLRAADTPGRGKHIPEEDLLVELANQGVNFSVPRKTNYNIADPFIIHEPGFSTVGTNIIAVKCPEGLTSAETKAWEERTQQIYEILFRGDYVQSTYEVSEEPRKFTLIEEANNLFVKGKVEGIEGDCYRTPDGRFIYEVPVEDMSDYEEAASDSGYIDAEDLLGKDTLRKIREAEKAAEAAAAAEAAIDT